MQDQLSAGLHGGERDSGPLPWCKTDAKSAAIRAMLLVPEQESAAHAITACNHSMEAQHGSTADWDGTLQARGTVLSEHRKAHREGTLQAQANNLAVQLVSMWPGDRAMDYATSFELQNRYRSERHMASSQVWETRDAESSTYSANAQQCVSCCDEQGCQLCLPQTQLHHFSLPGVIECCPAAPCLCPFVGEACGPLL